MPTLEVDTLEELSPSSPKRRSSIQRRQSMQLEPKPPKSKRPDMVSRRHTIGLEEYSATANVNLLRSLVSAKEGPEAKKTIARRSSAVLSDLQIKSGQRRMSLSTWSPNASQETDGSGSPSSHSPVMQRKSMKRRASVSAIASARMAVRRSSARTELSLSDSPHCKFRGDWQPVGSCWICSAELCCIFTICVAASRGSVTEQRRLSLKRAATTPMTAQPEIVNLAPSEALTGVQVRKPSDRAKAEERDRQKAAPKIPGDGSGPSVSRRFVPLKALIHLADHGEERVCRFGELLYREGDKQKTNWMAMVLSGRLSNQIHAPFGEKGTMPELRAGALFGELGALQVWEGRHSTVLVIQTDRMWEAVRGAADDVQRIESECECWRAFMLSDIASRCPAEIAYHFREAASLRKLEQELGVRNQQRQLWAAAVIESGKACVKETGEVLRAKETSNVAAMLGIQSSETLLPEGGKPCNIAVLDRKDFWKIVHEYPQAREVYTKWALSQLPSATVDISCVPILQFLEGSQVFIRALAGSIRQRVVPPGMDAITAKAGLRSDFRELDSHGRDAHIAAIVGIYDTYGADWTDLCAQVPELAAAVPVGKGKGRPTLANPAKPKAAPIVKGAAEPAAAPNAAEPKAAPIAKGAAGPASVEPASGSRDTRGTPPKATSGTLGGGRVPTSASSSGGTPVAAPVAKGAAPPAEPKEKPPAAVASEQPTL
eukprot:s7480_g1.t1